MAKMFYTLEEAAEALGLSTDQVKEMAGEGKLQQFRDRDKLMFKREEVDALAANDKTESDAPIPLSDDDDDDSEDISNNASDDTDAISLSDETSIGGQTESSSEDTNSLSSSGVSVFETDEVDTADPMAQTQVTQSPGGSNAGISQSNNDDDDDLALDSVGSGSGLLDLTRESDDTSLGAELLDEIYPGGGSESSDSKSGEAASSSGAFESGAAMDSGMSDNSGIQDLEGSQHSTAAPAATSSASTASYQQQSVASDGDPLWSGLSAGLLLGTTIALILGLIVAISSIAGATSVVTTSMQSFGYGISAAALLLICVILGIVGALIGKTTG